MACIVTPTFLNAFCCWTACSIESAINEVKAEKIVVEVMKLSLVDRVLAQLSWQGYPKFWTD